VILFSFLATLLGLWGYTRLGKEFLPPFDEGTLLFMPTTLPGVSMESALKTMIYQDRVLKSFPEVLSVHGKVGRAESSTDPAPISMLETVVVLKPHDQWRKKERWYHILPSVFHPFFRLFFPDRISTRELIEEMDRALRLPGVVHAWTFPIRNRIDMLTTGIRTPVGMKIYGPSLSTLQDLAVKAEGVLKDLPGVRSVIAERVMDGYYLDINPKRENLSRYGISLEALQMTLETLLSGMEITTLYEGRERYPVTIRVPREWKESWENLLSLPIVVKEGTFIPLSQVAEVEFHTGPAMIRNEKGFPVVYVFVDFAGGDLERFVELLKKEVKEKLSLPPGYFMEWTGQYESLQRVKERMKFLLPLTLAIIFLLIYLNTRSFFLTFTVLLAVPFSAVGAILLFHLLNYQVSVASWVGFIALMGLDAETGVFMLLYLEMAYKEKKKEKGKISQEDLEEAILYGASQRIRPKTMTVLTAWIGLLPIMLGTGIGSDITKRIAAPMVGGLLTSYLLELLVYPAIYKWYREREVRKNS
jgi:Cu(I)/Ag(I) efflux system membrane protein CusA/SilA